VKSVKLAVIGCGHLGRIHARLLANVEGAELVAVADPVAESRRHAATETGATAVADYRDLIGQIDAAIIAAPASMHHAIGMDLLRHGVHLLIEKPLAVNVGEAEELVWAANWHGAMVQVGHIEQFNPALAQVLPFVQDPRLIEATRAGGYTFRSTDIGVVLDLMIHDLDLALHFANSPVRRVQALGISVLGDHEDVAQARLEFANGCVANLSASRISYKQVRHMQVWSDQGCVNFDFATRQATAVCPVTELLQREFDLDDIGPSARAHLKDHLFEDLFQMQRHDAAEQNALLEELKDFAGSIQEQREPRVTGLQGRNVLAVAEQVLQSIHEHAWDGSPTGRTGPMAMPVAPILRGPHWGAQKPATPVERRREAG
jgi:predicted dehydrogenase